MFHASITDGWEGYSFPFETLDEARAYLHTEITHWVNATGVPVISDANDSFVSVYSPGQFFSDDPAMFYITAQ